MADDTRGSRQRLDKAMVERALVPSRARAQDMIRRGLVLVDGKVEAAAGRLVAPTQIVALSNDAPSPAHVSRGGEKLNAALDAFAFDPSGRVCLDVGASTGGFTQVLLDRGARRVYAIDVGHGQLHPALAQDPRVVSHEDCDARTLDQRMIPQAVDVIVVDVSFISLLKVLPSVLALAAPGAFLVALIKPQFEAGRGAVGKGGIVREEAARLEAVARVRTFIAGTDDWQVAGIIPSPIAGGSGNVEYLIGARRG